MASQKTSGIASYFALLLDRIGSTPFPTEDRAIVRQHMLDAMAAAFIGCKSKVFQDLAQYCPKVSTGCVYPTGGPNRISPSDAGMLWAFAIHASVFEDGSREGACHPAAAVIPTIIALSQGRDWEPIDRAAIGGYDVMVRLARSGNPELTRRGFHPTAITAPFGAAATASLLFGYDSQKTQNALCLAALGSAGLMASFRRGETQPLQVAWSVRCGISAAVMAGAGHSGYPYIIEEGFYPAYLGSTPLIPVEKPLEHEYAVKGCYLKPYPGCRHVHPSIDALSEILKENGMDPSQIKKIRVRTYKVAIETEIHSLSGRGDAYFNIPYALAAKVVLGRNDWEAFDEKHFTDERILEVMKKVTVEVDEEIENHYPNQRGSLVEVEVEGGKTFREEVKHPLGEPENLLPFSITVEKFRDGARAFLSKKSMDRVEAILDVSGHADSAQPFFETLSEDSRARRGIMR